MINGKNAVEKIWEILSAMPWEMANSVIREIEGKFLNRTCHEGNLLTARIYKGVLEACQVPAEKRWYMERFIERMRET
jgi:hypothetical protein